MGEEPVVCQVEAQHFPDLQNSGMMTYRSKGGRWIFSLEKLIRGCEAVPLRYLGPTICHPVGGTSGMESPPMNVAPFRNHIAA
jgi:hypothetical protein